MNQTTRQASLLAMLYASLLLAPTHALGLILSTYNGPGTPSSVNTTAPVDDPGWHNVSSGFSSVYLGDQWVLTAGHVPTDPIELPSGIYTPIPGTEVTLTNPSFFDANNNGFANGFGVNSETLSTLSDIKLYRVDTHPTTGLTPEQMDANIKPITIASQTVLPGTELTAIASGQRRRIHPNPARPNGRWRFDANFNIVADDNSVNEGFLTTEADNSPTPREKAWGTNRIGLASGISGVVDDGLNGIVRVTGLNDTIGYFTKFDRGVDNNGVSLGDGGLPDEFQAAAGDSGGPVFSKNLQGDWELLGVFHAIYGLPGQSASALIPLYDQHTALSDLSQQHYYNQIAALRASDEYSVMGDIDLDGVVSGEIINGVPTGDLAALVTGWEHNQVAGDIVSWKQGDLNQDGFTDLSDFVLLRDALGGSISVSQFSLLVATSVPEPSTLILALGSLVLAAAIRR